MIDFSQINSLTGKSNFLQDDDITKILPIVKDYRSHSFREGDIHSFPISVNIILNLARKADTRGKKSEWQMQGGPERKEATELYRLAIRIGS